MGQKVHPIGFRLGIIKTWDSKWYSDKKNYVEYLHEDLKLKKYLKNELMNSAVSKIEIERAANRITINIVSARAGFIIGAKGHRVEQLKKNLMKLTKRPITINIKELRNWECDAQLVSESISLQLKRRVAFRKAMKNAIRNAKKSGCKGIKIACSGRLGGAEMARSEQYKDGRVPLHTLRANIEYGFAESLTTYGKIGVKVWVYKGDVKKSEKKSKPHVDLYQKKDRKQGDKKGFRRKRRRIDFKKRKYTDNNSDENKRS